MTKVFLIHGFEGSPNGGWRPWLMAELEKMDIYACALSMPSPDEPKVNEWVEEIARHVKRNENDEIYLVGHSLGVPAILRFLEATESRIKGAILVSGPAKIVNNEKIDDFLSKPFDFSKITQASENFLIIHGDNDSRVPLSDGELLSKELKTKLIVIPNGGHLNGSSGWTALPECLTGLLEMMKGRKDMI